MTTKPPNLLTLSDARDYHDGTVSFRVDREDGERLAVSCSVDELTDILNHVFALARLTEGEDMRLAGLTRSLALVQIDQLAVGTSEDLDRTTLVAKIGAFELALSIANSGFSGFSDDLAQTLKTLSANRDQRN